MRRLARPGPLFMMLAWCLWGCRIPYSNYSYYVSPGTAPHCADGVCFEIVAFTSDRSDVGAWLDAPAGARLRSARFAFDRDPPCGGGVPVAWVRVGPKLYRSGPADVVGHNGLVLGFPDKVWWAHDCEWTASFVDLDLEIQGQARCVRAGLVRANGSPLVGP